MPQSHRAFKAMTLPLLCIFALWSGPAPAQDEAAPDRMQLYVCGTGPEANQGYIELSATEEPSGGFADLKLQRMTRDNQPIWSFPPRGVDAKTAFLFSHSNGPEGYLVSIRFKDGDLDYVLYSLYVPPDPNDEGDAGGASGGLVSSRDGKLVDDIECGENPYEFITYMQRSMSCDLANPLGKAACEEYEPQRTAPLDVTRIGIVPAGIS